MDTNEKITTLGIKNSSVKLVKKDSILLSFKLSIGKMAIAGTELYTNEAIASINSLTDTLSNKYLYYCIKLLNIKKYGRGAMSENGSLNLEQLRQIKIPIFKNNNYEKLIDSIIIFEKTIENYNTNITITNELIDEQFTNYFIANKSRKIPSKKIDVDTEFNSETEAELEAQLNAEISSKNTKRPKNKVNIV